MRDPIATWGPPSRHELRCPGCGYGVTVRIAPSRCPMCGGSAWGHGRGRSLGLIETLWTRLPDGSEELDPLVDDPAA